LRTIQANAFEGSSSELQKIPLATKIQCWKDVARGKSKGKVYGIAYLAANI